ncbi:unnamed protein product [Zymoseptoria tritici ST99CH_1A5]|uniref:Reverse transcriptase domain-containing protein n=1 Tax=Zymoseptoria tritici ST99CH_1A5 TaxID=1276529 RepID=A0A1Y6M1C1_ZYMTR|nr:unnamed protein product [Zymoseptoria tritici ST99CH_1A5]
MPAALPIPRALFFADNSVLLASDLDEVRLLIQILECWSSANRIALNIKKCAYLAPASSQEAIYLFGAEVLRREVYTYLGFPVTARGINLRRHLKSRLEQAGKQSDFLTLDADGWGFTHRLRVYQQYLALMFEYGAPLLAAFAEDSPKFWDETTKDVAKLTKWISGYASNPHFTRNLLGISALPSRFKALKTGFQVVKKHAPEESPLRKLGLLIWKPKAFFRRLTEDKLYEKYRKTPESWPRDRSLSEDRRSV